MVGEDSYVLLHRCASGADTGAWEDFVARYGPRLRQVVQQALAAAGERACADAVDEQVQDLYCRLLEGGGRRLRGFRGGCDGEAVRYLARMARNVVADEVRERRAVKRGPGATSEPERVAELPDRAPGPEERFLARERRRVFLAHCRRALAGERVERNLRIVQLALLEGWTSREISRHLGGTVAAGAVDSVLHRTRRRLLAEGIGVPAR